MKKLHVNRKQLERLLPKAIKCSGIYQVIEEQGQYYNFLDDLGIETQVHKDCFTEVR